MGEDSCVYRGRDGRLSFTRSTATIGSERRREAKGTGENGCGLKYQQLPFQALFEKVRLPACEIYMVTTKGDLA